MELTWKQRLYASLPYVLVLLGAAGIAVTEEVWLAIVSLVGMWFLPSPLNNLPNVSRETSEREPVTTSRSDDLPLPCQTLHGSAEVHVLGCEGWRSPE